MAGLKIGVYKSLKDISKRWSLDKKFSPKVSNKFRMNLIKGWNVAVKRTLITWINWFNLELKINKLTFDNKTSIIFNLIFNNKLRGNNV